MRHLKVFSRHLWSAFSHWGKDEVPRLGASLSFYTVFSLAPLLLLSISVAGVVFGREAVQGHIYNQLSSLIGKQEAKIIQDMIRASYKPVTGVIGMVIGFVTLLVGAAGVTGELKNGLNKIWGVKSVVGFRFRLTSMFLSLGMILGIGFLLLVSLLASAFLVAVGEFFRASLPLSDPIAHLLDTLVSLGAITVLFAAIFKGLPDAKIAWRPVWMGSLLTSFLFVLGKFVLGFYLGRYAVSSSYGSAGAVLVILLWVYYSAQILYFGAEFTKVYADREVTGFSKRSLSKPSSKL